MVKEKNPAATKLSVLAHASMTPAERKERARKAVAVRWRKAKPPAEPQRWYGVCLIPLPDDLHGGVRAIAKILDEAHAKPDVILWTSDRDEARARARKENLDGKCAEIIDVDYKPTLFTIQREFKPDVEAQIKALRVLADEQGLPR